MGANLPSCFTRGDNPVFPPSGAGNSLLVSSFLPYGLAEPSKKMAFSIREQLPVCAQKIEWLRGLVSVLGLLLHSPFKEKKYNEVLGAPPALLYQRREE